MVTVMLCGACGNERDGTPGAGVSGPLPPALEVLQSEQLWLNGREYENRPPIQTALVRPSLVGSDDDALNAGLKALQADGWTVTPTPKGPVNTKHWATHQAIRGPAVARIGRARDFVVLGGITEGQAPQAFTAAVEAEPAALLVVSVEQES